MPVPARLILIGYRGTGKTSTGRALASRLGVPFVDADIVLEERLGCSIADLFRERGEGFFRDRESEVLRSIFENPAYESAVVSTGGGAVIRPENRELLRTAGVVIHLVADADTIHDRLKTDPTTGERRPQLTSLSDLAEIRALLAVREPWYADCAQATANTVGFSPEQVADHILLWWPMVDPFVKAS